VSNQILHVDLVLLREDVSDEALSALYEEAGRLKEIEGVVQVGVIESGARSGQAAGGSDFDLAFFFVIDSVGELEAFGTDQRYVRFLQGGVARTLRSFGGADALLRDGFCGAGEYGACAALAATPQTYDWQVQDALAGWAAFSDGALTGLAVGERQRYRGVGMIFSGQPISRPASGFEGFGLDFISGRCRLLS
jgi:hypothetical protein